VYHSVFNDFFLIQLFIIIIVSFFYSIYEPFYLIINSVFFLILVSVYAWLNDLDIIINFLIIIDLGVFFIFFAFALNLVQLFSWHKSSFFNSWGWFLTASLTIFLMLLQYSFSSYFVNWNYQNMLWLWCFNVSYYEWYGVYMFAFYSDLQLLSDVYFKFNFVEFFFINVILYLIIVIVYFVMNINQLVFVIYQLTVYNYFINYHKFNFYYYLKSQNFTKQTFFKTNVRVWAKTKKTSIDFKANVGKVDW